MEERLIEKLAKVREALTEKKALGIEKLESLKAETKRAFDEAIDRVYTREQIAEELVRRREALAAWRVGFFQTLFPVFFKKALSMPFIYGMLVPVIFFHIGLEVYHQVCFRLYGIPLVNAGAYFSFDRRMLPYLNWFEKLNCLYCSYYNNLLQYAVEIGGRTERYWCPIKHATRLEATHSQYEKFVDYLDGENYHTKMHALRDFSDIKSCTEERCDFGKKE